MEQFNIKAVVKYSGINAHTLRAWERRYAVIKPIRATNGRRMYSVQEAERLRIIAQLVSYGHAISNLSRLTDDERLSLLRHVGSEACDEKKSNIKQIRKLVTTPEAISASCRAILNILSNFELEKLHTELRRAKAQHTARSFVFDVASPLLKQIGNQVMLGQLSIAQEHAFSALMKVLLAEIIFSLRRGHGLSGESADDAFTVTLATQDGDLHEFGILMSAVLCSIYGVRCHYLGPNLPAQPLAEAAELLRSSAVLLGRTSVLSRQLKGSEQVDYLGDLHRLMPLGIEMWIGGSLECDLKEVAADDGGRTIRYIRSLQDLDSHLLKLTNSGQAGLRS